MISWAIRPTWKHSPGGGSLCCPVGRAGRVPFYSPPRENIFRFSRCCHVEPTARRGNIFSQERRGNIFKMCSRRADRSREPHVGTFSGRGVCGRRQPRGNIIYVAPSDGSGRRGNIPESPEKRIMFPRRADGADGGTFTQFERRGNIRKNVPPWLPCRKCCYVGRIQRRGNIPECCPVGAAADAQNLERYHLGMV